MFSQKELKLKQEMKNIPIKNEENKNKYFLKQKWEKNEEARKSWFGRNERRVLMKMEEIPTLKTSGIKRWKRMMKSMIVSKEENTFGTISNGKWEKWNGLKHGNKEILENKTGYSSQNISTKRLYLERENMRYGFDECENWKQQRVSLRTWFKLFNNENENTKANKQWKLFKEKVSKQNTFTQGKKSNKDHFEKKEAEQEMNEGKDLEKVSNKTEETFQKKKKKELEQKKQRKTFQKQNENTKHWNKVHENVNEQS